jgi:N-acetylneuraminate synthase
VSETAGLRLRRSLFIAQDVVAGDLVTEANVRSIRPSGGLAPDLFGVVKGRTFRADARMGTPLSWDVI